MIAANNGWYTWRRYQSTSMATAEEKKEEGEGEAVTMEAQSPSRPVLNSRRKPSFSQAFTNITTNPFNRRRTATTVSDLASANTHIHSSRLPTPSGIPRSTSFFSSLGAFASKPASTNDANESSAHSAPPKRSRIISSRLAQAPFFSYQQQDVNTTPLTTKQKRESSVQIEQRGLMAPLHPPMPRSSTMGNLGQSPQAQSSPNTPSFMRPTSSSAARRSSLNTPRQRIPPMPTIPAMPTMSAKKTPTLGRRVPSFGFKTASNTPATPATPAIQRARPVKTPVRSVVKPETPPDSGVLAPNNTPESEHTTSSHHSQEPASRIRTSSQPHHTRKSSLIPAPIQARRNVSQDMAQRQEQNPLPSFSDFGDDGTNEFQGPKIHDSGPEEDTTALEQIQERDESSRAETVVPAGTAKETPSETTTHPDGEEENAGEPMGLTSASEVNADDDDDAPEPLPANLDMSNPRLVSSHNLPPVLLFCHHRKFHPN